MNAPYPETQKALQLTGPDELTFTDNKPIHKPGPHQILGKVEAVGICFSDLKLLKQFEGHARKTEIISGIEESILSEIPSYVSGVEPTVPGHEAVVRICEVGDQVTDIKVGGRYLVQTDYRWLPTAESNASFGYNFEGALQEYVLMDQRVITSPDGESMLIPASDDLAASAIALVEPWACVEDAYAVKERSTLTEGGHMLIVADREFDAKSVRDLFANYGRPGEITLIAPGDPLSGLDINVTPANSISELTDAAYDDVVYFGCDVETAEQLFPKTGPNGLVNIVQCGGQFGKTVSTQIGRVHYGNIRLIGTPGHDPADAMSTIPPTGEIRPDDKINVIGAAGPMGVMHVVRDICQGVAGISVYGGDLDADRLAKLNRIAQPMAEKNGVSFHPYNPKTDPPAEKFDYILLMAPIPALVAAAVTDAAPKAIVNIFAGIPASVSADIDLDTYIANRLYFIGTSGSTLDDMRTVLAKVEAGRLDTNISVAAIGSIHSAADGIRAVEKALVPGKIVVYPSLPDLPLTPLDDFAQSHPKVQNTLGEGTWNRQSEQALLETA